MQTKNEFIQQIYSQSQSFEHYKSLLLEEIAYNIYVANIIKSQEIEANKPKQPVVTTDQDDFY